MVYAVIGAMAFRNASRRDNAHNFVVNRLSAEDLWGPVEVTDSDYLDLTTAPTLNCEFRFINQAARDQFFADILAQLQGVNGPVVGSWVAKHDCHHDETPVAPCVVTERHNF